MSGKNDVFVAHVEHHLKELGLEHVCCKICGKTIDQIYAENDIRFCNKCRKRTLFELKTAEDKIQWLCSECKKEYQSV